MVNVENVTILHHGFEVCMYMCFGLFRDAHEIVLSAWVFQDLRPYLGRKKRERGHHIERLRGWAKTVRTVFANSFSQSENCSTRATSQASQEESTAPPKRHRACLASRPWSSTSCGESLCVTPRTPARSMSQRRLRSSTCAKAKRHCGNHGRRERCGCDEGLPLAHRYRY